MTFEYGFLGMTLRPSQIRASAADIALMMPGAASLLGRHGELNVPVVIMAGGTRPLAVAEAGPVERNYAMVLRDEIKHAAHIVIVGARPASVQGDNRHSGAPLDVVEANTSTMMNLPVGGFRLSVRFATT